MTRQRKAHLSQQDLKALGCTPGFVVRRYGAQERVRLEQLMPEGAKLRRTEAGAGQAKERSSTK